jgi:hypothetical protein
MPDHLKDWMAQESQGTLSSTALGQEGPFEGLIIAFAILATGWLANFSLSSQFGLYEDDYLLTASLFGMSWRGLTYYYFPWSFTAAPQARPLGYALNGLLAYFTGKLGLDFGYAVGWVILSANGSLIYYILRQRLGPRAGLIAALTYILFPADLAKQILMHRGFVHLAETCTLLGIFLYQKGTRTTKFVSYFVASLSLLIWEGPFIAFLIAPL